MGFLLKELDRKTREIIDLILNEKKELTFDTLLVMIKERIDELGGLIDEEAAAMLIAKELGIKLSSKEGDFQLSSLKIKDISPGYKNIFLEAYILKVTNIYKFKRDNEIRKYVRVLLGDDTGQIWMVLWDEKAIKAYKEYIPGDKVKIERGFCRRYKERIELGLLKDGNIQLLREVMSFKELNEIKDKFNLDILVFQIVDIIKNNKSTCIYCIDGNKKLYRLISYSEMQEIKKKQVIILQDPRIREISENFSIIYLNGFTRMYLFNRYPINRNIGELNPRPLLNIDTLSSLDNLYNRDVDIEGIYIGFIPFRRRGGSLWLTNGKQNIRIPLFDDDLLEKIIRIEPLNMIRIKGVSVRKRDDKNILRILPCSDIVLTREKIKYPINECSHLFIITDNCLLKNKSTVISFSIGIKEYKNQIIGGLKVRVDDGTAQSNIITNDEKIITSFLDLSLSELLEYKRDNILNDVLSYIKENIIGKDIFIEGILLKSKIIIPFSISLETEKPR